MIKHHQNITFCFLLSIFTLWTTAAIAIDAPSNPRGTEVGQLQVLWAWDPVPDAIAYELVVDGVNVYTTKEAQFSGYNLWAGEHSLTVRAENSDGKYSAPSHTAKIVVSDWFSSSNLNTSVIVGQELIAVTSRKKTTAPVLQAASTEFLSAPSDVSGTVISAGSVSWGWSSVLSATEYEITVDGMYSGTTQDTNYIMDGFWEGDHSMTVVAVGENGEKSAQSLTVKLWVGAGSLPVVQAKLELETNSTVDNVAPPLLAGNQLDSNIQSMVDPASFYYGEVYNKEGYELVFSDEFEGNTLNSYRWNTGLRWDGEYNGERYEYRVINGEDQFYVNIYSEDEEHISDITPSHNPFEFDGSRLAIRAVKNPLKTNNNNLAYGSMKEIASQQNFLSGAIATHNKFSQKFGYFEASIKIPSHVGTFPAFWLFHENSVAEGTQKTEIDIMENLGHAPYHVYNTFHYYKNVTPDHGGDYNFVKPYPDGQIFTGIDYSQDYHVYAVEWEPGKITWFIDGQKVSEYEGDEVNFEDLYVKLNLAIGGQWTSYPANAGGLGRDYPNQLDIDNFQNPALEIDYVRVFTKN